MTPPYDDTHLSPPKMQHHTVDTKHRRMSIPPSPPAQEDHLLPQMTVKEVLQFHAALLLRHSTRHSANGSTSGGGGGGTAGGGGAGAVPASPPPSTHRKRRCIERALAVMGLQRQADTLVSGGGPWGVGV